ncbi:MAG: hypothetical protein ACYC6L_15840 [Anaerolineae bacterium]
MSHAGAKARNPAFDVTPASLIKAIITQQGVHLPGELPVALV